MKRGTKSSGRRKAGIADKERSSHKLESADVETIVGLSGERRAVEQRPDLAAEAKKKKDRVKGGGEGKRGWGGGRIRVRPKNPPAC